MQRKDWMKLVGLVLLIFIAYFVDFQSPRVLLAVMEGFLLLQWYVRNHTLGCVIPAMFIAGAITTFLSKEAVLRHLGPQASPVKAYCVASVAGTVLAVCSCSVLPMFAAIYRVGAGLGPAAAFLYSGPAINVMAVLLTARVLGFPLGASRFLGAVLLAVLIGVMMAWVFRGEQRARTGQLPPGHASQTPMARKLWQDGIFLAAMIAFLVFMDWPSPSLTKMVLRTPAQIVLTNGSIVELDQPEVTVSILVETAGSYRVLLETRADGLPKGMKFDIDKTSVEALERVTPPGYQWAATVHAYRGYLAAVLLGIVLTLSFSWYPLAELKTWMLETWSFTKQIVPLLFAGVFVTGIVSTLLPEQVVAELVGGESLRSNLVAAVTGAAWYFATLTEIPIVEALLGLGMGQGPALSLLLAGPAVSLPGLAVIYTVWGAKKTAVFLMLVIIFSAAAGLAFGWWMG
ncbi:MAG: permease [Thermoguttaceae bacterium]|nr:permease [Thermoguttaceae bacterium]MDW8078659.1 permease [Thermoguttaceae bacterium]